MINISSARYVHCVGIGGIGVSGLAKLLLWRGMAVSGSDLRQTIVTDELEKLGINIQIGPHSARNIPAKTDLVIRTQAASDDNPEIIEAGQRGIPVMSYSEAVSQLTDGRRLITVSGTHGKTTTTAMIGQMLVAAGLDPTILVGSRLTSIGGNARAGRGDHFVLEGDEYKRAFLDYHPEIAVITNIEPDHLDVYRDIDDLKATFAKFLTNIKPNGCLVYDHDDANVVELSRCLVGRSVSYGLAGGDFRGTIQDNKHGTLFVEPHTGTVKLNIPGSFNVSNALAAIAVGHELKIPAQIIIQTLKEFTGLWRRFELAGEYHGAVIITDYAHHPTAVRVTVAAAREYYPNRRLIVAFQPHHRHRTKALFNEFIDALTGIDHLIVQEIYDVAGREEAENKSVSSQQLVDVLVQRGGAVKYTKDDVATETAIRKLVQPGDVVLIMGAGTIDVVARNLAKP